MTNKNRPRRPDEAITLLLEDITDFDLAAQESIEELVDVLDNMYDYADDVCATVMAELGAARHELEQAQQGIAQRDAHLTEVTRELQLAQGKLLGVALLVR
jgi:ABC-type Fe2+-enterobactin transport system substrate-binding protein